MFTGIIEVMGFVESVTPRPSGVLLCVRAPLEKWGYRPAAGDSVCVSGCCLTAVEAVGETGEGGDGVMKFDVIPETLSKTTLRTFTPGGRVNLERAATASTLLGGHIVQGHVDGVATIENITTEGEWRVRLRPAVELMQYMAPKGSVCLDGVSLTLAAARPKEGWIEVALIPTTLDKTTLREWRVGQGVNVEADAMAKMVVNYLRHFASVGTGLASGVGTL